MPNESKLSFDDLVARRHQLQNFCHFHYRSLTAFRDGISFKLNQGEPNLGGEVRHLSSTATCIESLLDCPPEFRPKGCMDDIGGLASDFGVSALRRPRDEWKSDGSARVYCRCRTLPLVVRHVPHYQDSVREHLETILSQLELDASRLAIGEAFGNKPDKHDWYPPNAYHTYWTLNLLDAIEQRFGAEFDKLRTRYLTTRFNLNRLRTEMLLWAQHTAGYQIALHASDSSTLDSDQLAWSLATIVTFRSELEPDLAQQDFIRHGLKCLFDKQTSIGIWRTGGPLFHYEHSGNAYCYNFETFAVLLKAALFDRQVGLFLRQALWRHVDGLLALWDYTTSTQIPVSEDGAIAWSSGHRPNRKGPESWATASVYSFSQCLRRLIGIWTRQMAAELLKVNTTHKNCSDAVRELSVRGDTWAHSGQPAASQLAALFVNPTRFFGSGNSFEPDSEPINEDQACAAILFGPPGTSKTTLSRCVANAIGWDYVELHASTFVADGLPNVQRTANTIFERLLQLDRTVILFDEIDELVREREVEPDAFGRFLTTSMLPKLAELWKLKKVIYFIATNHIPFFDAAVIRAQRFDALLHVSPPSFESKIRRLEELLAKTFQSVTRGGLTPSQVEEALEQAAKCKNAQKDVASSDEALLPESCMLAKFLLMRWDQLQELASAIRKRHQGEKCLGLDRKVLEDALADLSDASLRRCRTFADYLESRKYQQHDFSKVSIWEMRGSIPEIYKPKFTETSGKYWHVSRAAFGDFSDLPCHCAVVAPGVLECQEKGAKVSHPSSSGSRRRSSNAKKTAPSRVGRAPR